MATLLMVFVLGMDRLVNGFADEEAAGCPSSYISRFYVSELTRFSSVDQCWKELNAALKVLKLKRPTAPCGLMSASIKLF